MTPAASPSLAQSADSGILFQAKGLQKNFGGVQAVRDISLNIPAGVVFSIIGPNGAGKSTLLNLMSGIYQAGCRHHDIRWDRSRRHGRATAMRCGHGLAHASRRSGCSSGYRSLRTSSPDFTPGTTSRPGNISFTAQPSVATVNAARRGDEALTFVGLNGRAQVTAGSLSYGEQRMLEIARALATAPRLLMVDEPAAGLNAVEVDALLNRIAKLRDRGITVVMVEHNMDLVMKIADRIIVMDYGQYLFEGAPAEVQGHAGVIAAYLGAEVQ